MFRKKRITRSTGVNLELPVFNYLVELAEREERARSHCLNRIVRDYAARQGTPLPPPQTAERTS